MRKFAKKVLNEWHTIIVPSCPVCESMNAVRILISERARSLDFYCPHCNIEFDDKERIYLILRDGNRRLLA